MVVTLWTLASIYHSTLQCGGEAETPHLQGPEIPDMASNKVPDNVPEGKWENRKNRGKGGGDMLVKWGKLGKYVETGAKLGKDMGKNSSPLFPIFHHFPSSHHPVYPPPVPSVLKTTIPTFLGAVHHHFST